MHAVHDAPIVPITGAQKVNQNSETNAGPTYSIALGYLRAFIILLVLAHHAVLAYHPYAPPPSAKFDAQPLMWPVFPIVDSQRLRGIDFFVGFNDTFFMSLMFFLSGVFAWPSLSRKGSGQFLKDRLLRLGFPFVVSAAVLAPLAYYPAYRVTGADPSLAAFWKQWVSLSMWPSGPAWFIWVLLAFGCIAAGLYRLTPKWGELLGRVAATGSRSPFAFYVLIVFISAVAYIPMSLWFDPMRWISFGPFSFQVSRLLHYAVYFVLGIGIGAYGVERGLVESSGKLARRWPLWMLSSLLLFGVSIIAVLTMISAMLKGAIPLGLKLSVSFAFVLSCAASVFAFLALFLRFARRRVPLLDRLSNNSYGMYLLHYIFVTWLQFALLRALLPAAAKASIVFLGAVALSWVATAALRRVPYLGRVL